MKKETKKEKPAILGLVEALNDNFLLILNLTRININEEEDQNES